MRTRKTIWLTVLASLAVLAAAFAATSSARHAANNGTSAEILPAGLGHGMQQGGKLQERFLYVSTIAQSPNDPDFIAVIGADPRRKDFGKIANRIDMPNVGDELHHFGYSADQKRLLVPGGFSSRIHVFDVRRSGKRLSLRAVNDQLAAKSGYVVPHGVMATSRGRALVTMIGAATDTTLPGGTTRRVPS